jgi:hypothetical protein
LPSNKPLKLTPLRGLNTAAILKITNAANVISIYDSGAA